MNLNISESTLVCSRLPSNCRLPPYCDGVRCAVLHRPAKPTSRYVGTDFEMPLPTQFQK